MQTLFILLSKRILVHDFDRFRALFLTLSLSNFKKKYILSVKYTLLVHFVFRQECKIKILIVVISIRVGKYKFISMFSSYKKGIFECS